MTVTQVFIISTQENPRRNAEFDASHIEKNPSGAIVHPTYTYKE